MDCRNICISYAVQPSWENLKNISDKPLLQGRISRQQCFRRVETKNISNQAAVERFCEKARGVFQKDRP